MTTKLVQKSTMGSTPPASYVSMAKPQYLHHSGFTSVKPDENLTLEYSANHHSFREIPEGTNGTNPSF